MPTRLGVLVALGATVSAPAHAQEILLTGKLRGACPASIRLDATPATWESTYWAAGGTVKEGSGTGPWRPAGGVGGEFTTSVLEYKGFPAGPYGPRLGLAELRVGPWAAGALRAPNGLLEGGLLLQLGGRYHASWGTTTWRFGGGYGAFGFDRSPHLSTTLTYGVYSALGRYSRRSPCDPEPRPRAVGLASVLRVFVTHRRPWQDPAAQEWVLGLEFSPSFFLPPYNLFRLFGGRPQPVPWSSAGH